MYANLFMTMIIMCNSWTYRFFVFLQYHKHLFVHIVEQPAHPLLESVDVKEIYDKFPQKSGGLKELYEKGPQNSFFLVKFWADLNTNIQGDTTAFYGVSSQWVSLVICDNLHND